MKGISPLWIMEMIHMRRLGLDRIESRYDRFFQIPLGCKNWSFSPQKRIMIVLIFWAMIVTLHSEWHIKKSARSNDEIESYNYFTTAVLRTSRSSIAFLFCHQILHRVWTAVSPRSLLLSQRHKPQFASFQVYLRRGKASVYIRLR